MSKCEHADVDWDPVEVQYENNEVHVWQEGRCNTCNRLVQREFESNAAHTVIDDDDDMSEGADD